ncbi:MAG TPA: crosslink repair DNA glycosylase YcaQ family protein [Bellilinea sp.]
MATKVTGTIFPLSALRATVLDAQRLTTANAAQTPPSSDDIVNVVKVLGYLQIDTLNMVNRAHYVTLWSRLGSYDLDTLHQLVYTPGQRQLYEGWGHAACILPLEHYRYHRWRTIPDFSAWWNQDGNRELTDQTLERIRAEGGLRVGDFEYQGPKRNPWYDWKPSKTALEALFAAGDLMIADRVNFQRVYDIKERVLPDWVDAVPADSEEGRRFCVEQAARALGVFDQRNLNWYAYIWAKQIKPTVQELHADGTLVEIQGETMDGVRKWLVHRDTLPLLQRAGDGEIKTERTTFLSPFDSFFWAHERDQRLWGFNQVLECYKRPQDRIYGYFCLPILHKDRLVGRFDPKLDRKTGVLNLLSLALEPGVAADDELVAAVSAAMRDFLAWHGAKELRIDRSDPSDFGQKLLQALL